MAITSKLTTLAQLKMLAERINTVLDDYAKNGDLGSLAKKNEVALDDLAVALKELINGKQDATQVATAIQTAIAATGHAHFEEAQAVPTPAEAQDNVMYLVMNTTTNHYDIYAKVGDNVVQLDDTTVDLSGYATIQALTDAVSGLIKLTALSVETTETGNAVTGLSYDSATGKFTVTKGSTFLTATEMENTINGATATDAEVTAMLTEVFGA